MSVLLGILVGIGLVGVLGFVRRHRAPSLHTDPLTRLAMRDTAEIALGRLLPGDAVVMIDLDGLKAVNDAYGHDAGDEQLVALGSHLVSSVRRDDTVVRWGGDEFVVVLPGAGSGAVAVVDRIRRLTPVAFSAGVAVHTSGDPRKTLDAADAALLSAKRAGGALVVEA